MHPISVRFFFSLSSIVFFLVAPSFSKPPIPPSNNITLYGDAFLNATSITLTGSKNCTPPLPPPPFFPPKTAAGRAFHASPFRFLDPPSNAAASFSCVFSFTIVGANLCPLGSDGFAFLITPNTNFSSPSDGYMGLPIDGSDYIAVEFDTSFDPILGDINGNHVGVDSNGIRSLASSDLLSGQIDLKNGREWTAWIEYRDAGKSVTVWVGPSKETKPLSPVLDAQIDLSKKFKEFMRVGFTASTGKGSSIHRISTWKFKTFFGALPSTTPMDIAGQEYCLLCSSPNSNLEVIGPFGYRPRNKRALNGPIVFGGVALLAGIIFVSAIIVLGLFLMKRRRHSRARQIRTRFQRGRMVPKMISLTEIKSATNGFNHDRIIGKGASAVVYEGSIPSCGTVAVKRFSRESRVGSSISTRIPFNTEFATMVGCLRHRNLVQLQGWCCEGNELVLVYEYMCNGSLDDILHKRTHLTRHLTWDRRVHIIFGVASALIYLHEECESQIIHRDIKTCNILLDSDFKAKLGDFGMAEVNRHSLGTRYATAPVGTLGYLAPEYVFSGVSSVKTDVYSFGIVVLEVATGRRPVNENGVMLSDYVWYLWEKGLIVEGADGELMGRFDRAEMERVLMVGLWCVHPDCRERPTVREAVRMLRGECLVPVLPGRKPTGRVRSEGLGLECLGEAGSWEGSLGGVKEMTPWLTPQSHFSKN